MAFYRKTKASCQPLHWNLPDVLWFSQQSPPWTFKVVFRPRAYSFRFCCTSVLLSLQNERFFTSHPHKIRCRPRNFRCTLQRCASFKQRNLIFFGVKTALNNEQLQRPGQSTCFLFQQTIFSAGQRSRDTSIQKGVGKSVVWPPGSRAPGDYALHPSHQDEARVSSERICPLCPVLPGFAFPNFSALETSLPTTPWKHCNKKWNLKGNLNIIKTIPWSLTPRFFFGMSLLSPLQVHPTPPSSLAEVSPSPWNILQSLWMSPFREFVPGSPPGHLL